MLPFWGDDRPATEPKSFSRKISRSMSRTARAFRTTLVVSAFGYAAQGLSLIAIPLFLSTVGVGAYGLMVTVMAFCGYLNFADAGLSWGSMILIAQAHGRGNNVQIAHVIRHAIVLAAASGIVVVLAVGSVLFAASAGWRLPMFAHHPEADRLIVIAGVQLLLTLQFSVFYNLFHGLQHGYWTGFYQGLGRLIALCGAMAAAWLTHSIAAVMFVQLAMTALSGAAAAIHAWRKYPWAFSRGSWFDTSQYRAQLRIGAKNFLLQIGRTLSGTAPTLAISSILGPAAVPLYTVPTTLLGLFFTPINSWNASMQSAYGEAWTSGAAEWTRNAFRQSLERALLVGGLGIAMFIALGDSFIRLWTHGRLWMEPAMTASVSCIVFSGALIAAGEYLLTGLNRHRSAAVAELANGALAIASIPLLVRWLGLGSVGIGWVAAAAATSGWILRREIRFQLGPNCFPSPYFVVRLALAVASGAVAAVSIAGLGEHHDIHLVALHMVLGCVAGVVAFAGVTVALGLVDSGEAAAFGRRLRESFAASPT